jgi:hypothetical protein
MFVHICMFMLCIRIHMYIHINVCISKSTWLLKLKGSVFKRLGAYTLFWNFHKVFKNIHFFRTLNVHKYKKCWYIYVKIEILYNLYANILYVNTHDKVHTLVLSHNRLQTPRPKDIHILIYMYLYTNIYTYINCCNIYIYTQIYIFICI